MDQRRVICSQILANAGVDAARLAASRFDLGTLATQSVHIGGGTAQIRDRSGKAFHLVTDLFDLADHRVLRAALDDAPLVLGDGAEGAPAKTATHDVDTKADHLPGRDPGHTVVTALLVSVARVRAACIRQIKDQVHLNRAQRNRRRRDPDIACGRATAVRLDQSPCIAGIGFQMQNAVGMRVQHRVAPDLLVAWQSDH